MAPRIRTVLSLPRSQHANRESTPQLNDPLLLKEGLCYVGGECLKSLVCICFRQKIPATSRVVCKSPDFDAEDTDSAINAAARSFETIRLATGRERSKLLRK
ncbi:uncharacterized protein BO97DRAFT_418036 [Aspergillus homomorphus CBS 101889]|uniref:Aldehyde dehydrogenase domain-containing protein n=1 Tax=Aspergillus homomorphus (strain CBS 101889) TaxID=1450537 RepID=A0A395HP50_ASPHC|nr:hypothetical protein BO97DRAFT_418036 [Aspergillus homomorphus CBS 101889]RAL08044.1 hypothetical protein BO97DRAFT_418036 [Aspergillus homomorphus CBS 101889]